MGTLPAFAGAGDTPIGNCGEGSEVFANNGNLEQGEPTVEVCSMADPS